MESPIVGGFISAPIKLAALIDNKRARRKIARDEPDSKDEFGFGFGFEFGLEDDCDPLLSASAKPRQRKQLSQHSIATRKRRQAPRSKNLNSKQPLNSSTVIVVAAPVLLLLLLALGGSAHLIGGGAARQPDELLRHKTHYMSIVPSTHFNYQEGRQSGRGAEPGPGEAGAGASPVVARSMGAFREESQQSHIYKRSSALVSSSPGLAVQLAHYPQLVSSTRPEVANANPSLRRRMMSESHNLNQARWASPAGEELQQLASEPAGSVSGPLLQITDDLIPRLASSPAPAPWAHKAGVGAGTDSAESESALLRQKQHIQYHDQWPSLAGKCHKRTLNFCAQVLPFNTTTFPNIIGDTNRFEVKRSLPFFGFLAKSSCNKRLDELLCLLLEPPCSVHTGNAIPPCKKFCRLALEGCNEYIPATLALSSVFDCRQYPDSSDPNVCVNLAQGSKCAADEFKCPDKTCIPRNWLCDGVRDCIFAADEANCTVPTNGSQMETSVCSTEEFKCDAKCVPKAWKCDGERDCLDGSDEESCDQRPRCTPDRFRCADGNGCIPKRWVCDGKAECRDGSDEMNCNQRECSESDFKCDNGICIPKIWRCDHQFDCKDGSDERSCIYPTMATSTTTTSTTTTTTTAQTPETDEPSVYVNASYAFGEQAAPEQLPKSEAGSEPEAAESQPIMEVVNSDQAGDSGANNQSYPSDYPQHQQHEAQAQLSPESHLRQQESRIGSDVSRIIQHESTLAVATTGSAPPVNEHGGPSSSPASARPVAEQTTELPSNRQQQQQRFASAKEMKKFDYDILPANGQNQHQLNELTGGPFDAHLAGKPLLAPGKQQSHNMLTQVDFVQQQQQQQAMHQQQPLQQQQQQQRLPIYRSLFKTLKGGPMRGGHMLAPGGPQQPAGRHVVAIARRRRDRQGQLGGGYGTAPGGQRHEELGRQHYSNSNEQPPNENLGQVIVPAANHTAPAKGHGVASYLQLLNNRYNLRLARMQPQQQPQQ